MAKEKKKIVGVVASRKRNPERSHREECRDTKCSFQYSWERGELSKGQWSECNAIYQKKNDKRGQTRKKSGVRKRQKYNCDKTKEKKKVEGEDQRR